MDNTATKIPQCLIWPIAICFLVGKIVTFPFYLVYLLFKDVWEDVSDLVGGLWYDWYNRG